MRATSNSPVETEGEEHAGAPAPHELERSPVADKMIRDEASIETAHKLNRHRDGWLDALLNALSAWPC